jgi:hypothetical protein
MPANKLLSQNYRKVPVLRFLSKSKFDEYKFEEAEAQELI